MTCTALDVSNWESILIHCGVASAVASDWSPIFSAEIDDGAFSAGLKMELPDFLGNILHESLMLERLEENLYYTRPERLMQVWPRRFPTLAIAQQYTRSPRKLVLIKLADNSSDVGECWPSYQHIADQCEISRRSVVTHIEALCEAGLLKKDSRMGPQGKRLINMALNLWKMQRPVVEAASQEPVQEAGEAAA